MTGTRINCSARILVCDSKNEGPILLYKNSKIHRELESNLVDEFYHWNLCLSQSEGRGVLAKTKMGNTIIASTVIYLLDRLRSSGFS